MRLSGENNFRSAFTLVEMLMAVAIFSVIAVSVYAIFIDGLTLNKRTRQLYDISRDTRWLLEIMAADVENSIDYRENSDGNPSLQDNAGPFQGDGASLSFFRQTPEGLIKIRYFFKPAGDGLVRATVTGGHESSNTTVVNRSTIAQRLGNLVREESSVGGSDGKNEETLSRFVVQDSLRFFYGQIQDEQLVWLSEWRQQNEPAAVRVELTLRHPDDENQTFVLQRDLVVPTGMWGERL